MSTFAHHDFSRNQASPGDSEAPIFIVGMPRSGTSLVEQILASHKDVFGAGERGEIKEFADKIRYPKSLQDISEKKNRESKSRIYRNNAKSIGHQATLYC